MGVRGDRLPVDSVDSRRVDYVQLLISGEIIADVAVVQLEVRLGGVFDSNCDRYGVPRARAKDFSLPA